MLWSIEKSVRIVCQFSWNFEVYLYFLISYLHFTGLTVSSHDSASFNALEWLHFNKYDTSKALTGMVTNPLPEHVEGKWAEEEKRLFEQGEQFLFSDYNRNSLSFEIIFEIRQFLISALAGIKQFGKHFDKIRREYLPKKNTNDLVEYYYLWKVS